MCIQLTKSAFIREKTDLKAYISFGISSSFLPLNKNHFSWHLAGKKHFHVALKSRLKWPKVVKAVEDC